MTPSYIIIHDSDSKYGNSLMINSWHEDRGFKWFHKNSMAEINIGYHAVVLNGLLWSSTYYSKRYDGLVVPGRPTDVQGAHCLANGRNNDSLGICLIGPPFSEAQIQSAIALCREWREEFNIPLENIRGHKEEDPTLKRDPRFDMVQFRKNVKGRKTICGMLSRAFLGQKHSG